MLPSSAAQGEPTVWLLVTLLATSAMMCTEHHESDDDEDLVISCGTDLGQVGQGSATHRGGRWWQQDHAKWLPTASDAMDDSDDPTRET